MGIMRTKISFFILFIYLALVIAPAYANGIHAENDLQKAKIAFTDLMLAFSSRPNATTPETEQILGDINRHSSKAMFSELAKTHNPKQLRLFASKLRNIIDTFKEDYSTAPSENEIKAAITNEFYIGILDAAKQSSISYEQFVLAFFKAGASLEKGLDNASTIALADRELINLLLTSTSYQLQFRSYFRNLFDAFTLIQPVPFPRWPNALSNLELIESNVHTILLSSLEDLLADPLVLADAVTLKGHQFNLAAQSDLSSMLIYLNLHILNGDEDSFLTELAERMNEVGGVMSNMDVETLISSGVIASAFLMVPEAAIYNGINPYNKVSYRPIKALPAQLEGLGVEIRTSPDFGLFENPFLAFFQLTFDSILIHDLVMFKWKKLGDEVLSAEMRLANMQERYELRRNENKLKSKLFKRLKGVGVEEEKAIRSLLTVPYFF